MRKVEAIIRPDRLQAVQDALDALGGDLNATTSRRQSSCRSSVPGHPRRSKGLLGKPQRVRFFAAHQNN